MLKDRFLSKVYIPVGLALNGVKNGQRWPSVEVPLARSLPSPPWPSAASHPPLFFLPVRTPSGVRYLFVHLFIVCLLHHFPPSNIHTYRCAHIYMHTQECKLSSALGSLELFLPGPSEHLGIEFCLLVDLALAVGLWCLISQHLCQAGIPSHLQETHRVGQVKWVYNKSLSLF